jgi:hypothetical protein
MVSITLRNEFLYQTIAIALCVVLREEESNQNPLDTIDIGELQGATRDDDELDKDETVHILHPEHLG